LPKIGPDGARPADVYARPAGTLPGGARPAARIAVLMTGLGISQSSTATAIAKLPAPVTLAFAPYGSDLERHAAQARSSGHEVMLQVPMEPFDYPDNDPGPQTLLTTLTPEQNLDRLYWHLSRFQGYAGIANFMGARFTASDSVMQPVIREAAKRGLGYLDDGSSPRSIALAQATAQSMPFAKADFTIDAVPTSVEIDRVLVKLETLARERGLAVGVASALPISIERLAAWTKTLESRGILLVPLTTAMLKSKSG
jgi:polysaccharide deacetylase 2 family uncharacterized protein YibQ